MQQSLNPSATNTTNYPLTGGLKPNSPGFPAEINPEIHRLQEENAKLSEALRICELEARHSQDLINLKDLEITRSHEIILALAGKTKQN